VLAAGAIAGIDLGQTIAVIHVLINALNSEDAPPGRSSRRVGNDREASGTGTVRCAAAEALWRIREDRTPARRVVIALLGNVDWLDREVGESLLVFLGELM
jgi:hypothetical protein